jgi:hypothetical protein
VNVSPPKDRPLRLRPHDGEPECLVERVAQGVWEHRILLYVAAVVTLTLIVQVFGWGQG